MKEFNAGNSAFPKRIIGGEGEEEAAEEAAEEPEEEGDDEEGDGDEEEAAEEGGDDGGGGGGGGGGGAASTTGLTSDKPLQVIDMREQLSGVTNVKWRDKGLEVLKTVCYYINNGPDATCIDTGYSGEQRPTLPSKRIPEYAKNDVLKTLFEQRKDEFIDFITEKQEDDEDDEEEEEEEQTGGDSLKERLNKNFMEKVESVKKDGEQALTNKLVEEVKKVEKANNVEEAKAAAPGEPDEKAKLLERAEAVKNQLNVKPEDAEEEQIKEAEDLLERAKALETELKELYPQDVKTAEDAKGWQIMEAEKQKSKPETEPEPEEAAPVHPMASFVESDNALNNMSAITILNYWTQKVVEQVNCHADSHTQIEDIEQTVLNLARKGFDEDIEDFKTVVLTPIAELGREKLYNERVSPRKDTLSILKEVLEKVDNKEHDYVVLKYIKILGELYPLDPKFVKTEYIIFTSPKDDIKRKQIEEIIKKNKDNFKGTDKEFQKMLGADISELSEVNDSNNAYSLPGLGIFKGEGGGKKKKKSNKKTKKKKRAKKNKTR
tara:strand:+ start:2779 stop:4422 length:1644 start_codon:yes stop_codon:yes gene_type:complete